MATLTGAQSDFLRTQDIPVTQLGLQRLRLLQHAGAIMAGDTTALQPEDLARLSQTLLTALELLKVADEELREERRTNATIQTAQDLRLAHLEAMFALAPTALVLTTGDTTIRRANAASARLFGVDVYSLTGMQLWEMVPKPKLAEFKKQLALAIEVGVVEAWSFPLHFRRSSEGTVCATMHVINDGAVGTRALYWALRHTEVPGGAS